MSTLRDLRGVPFAQVETELLRDPTIAPQCKALYAVLITYGPERIFPGHETLAKSLGCTRRSVIRWMKKLKSLGLVAWERRGSTSNIYTLLGYQCDTHVTTDVQWGSQQMCNGDHNRCDTGVTRSISSELDPVINISEESPKRDAPPTPTSCLEWESWLDRETDDGKKLNKPALVMRMLRELYPNKDPPSYGEIGACANAAGSGKNGYTRLIRLLWRFSAPGEQPDGDVIPYIRGVLKGRGKDNGRTEHKTVPRQIVTGWEDCVVEPVPEPIDGQ